ncbi:hypothetical protein [Streptomyces fradiae]|uniref:hypothetical protein n=1 Tax=Streptomyces fradiae TaxID=1906 RepID=UPI0037BA253C
MSAQRDRTQLLELLRENIDFLKASAASFDAGFEHESKRLAVTLRVLLHDTARSHSLLSQLDAKKQITFTDTADHINPHNLLTTATGLVIMQMTVGVGASYVAPLGDLPPWRMHPPARFEPWWTGDVARAANGVIWSREKFVLTMANKEGGAHVDPKLNTAYEDLAKHNGFGFVSDVSGAELPFDGNAAAASVRQISYEVLRTLENHASLFN